VTRRSRVVGSPLSEDPPHPMAVMTMAFRNNRTRVEIIRKKMPEDRIQLLCPLYGLDNRLVGFAYGLRPTTPVSRRSTCPSFDHPMR
jgi:hypothetical protein